VEENVHQNDLEAVCYDKKRGMNLPTKKLLVWEGIR